MAQNSKSIMDTGGNSSPILFPITQSPSLGESSVSFWQILQDSHTQANVYIRTSIFFYMCVYSFSPLIYAFCTLLFVHVGPHFRTLEENAYWSASNRPRLEFQLCPMITEAASYLLSRASCAYLFPPSRVPAQGPTHETVIDLSCRELPEPSEIFLMPARHLLREMDKRNRC